MHRSYRMYGREETCIQSFWSENVMEGDCPEGIGIDRSLTLT
jgi:hypothetical protein